MSLVTAHDAEIAQSRAAAGLKSLGINKGDRVGFCVDSSPLLLLAIAGGLRVGIVPVVINPRLLENERRIIFDDAEISALILSELELEGLFGLERAELSDFPMTRPMLYTSGTTGQPKGVWTGILSDSDSTRLWSEEISQWSFNKSDVHLVCSPLYHSAPLRFAICTWLAGGSVVVLDGFSVERVIEAVNEFRPTTTFCTPAHLQRLDEVGRLGIFSSLRLVLHAGSRCDERLKRKAIAEIGVDVLWEFYGSTEGQFTVCSSSEWLQHPGSVGRARDGRVLSIDADGLVWCWCPEYARWEYWKDPDKTVASWCDGKFSVGDLGHIDDDGYLFLSGRRDDLIITGGVNVYPEEIEGVLRGCHGVVDVVVFGRDDERWGTRVCAAVVGGVSDAELWDYASEHLAPFKRPKEYHKVDAIPRSALDKVRRSTMSNDLGLNPFEIMAE